MVTIMCLSVLTLTTPSQGTQPKIFLRGSSWTCYHSIKRSPKNILRNRSHPWIGPHAELIDINQMTSYPHFPKYKRYHSIYCSITQIMTYFTIFEDIENNISQYASAALCMLASRKWRMKTGPVIIFSCCHISPIFERAPFEKNAYPKICFVQ